MRETLIVMAKAPRAGEVKTRLAGALGPEGARALYECLLRDTFALAGELRTRRPGVRVALCYAPEGAAPEFDRLALDHDVAIAQRGGDLGERIANGFADTFARGARSVVIVGADSPTLPVERLAAAFDGLARGIDVALGPTKDGGYYLVGARRLHEASLRSVPWSTDGVLRATVDRAAEAGLTVATLEPWYDVDERADLARLRRDVSRPDSPCRRTRELFERSPARPEQSHG